MSTAKIRQNGLEAIGCGECEPSPLLPMTYMEAVRTAEGYLEELGLVGYLSVELDYSHFSTGTVSLRWTGYFSCGDGLPSARYEAPTAERMLTGFRLELLKLTGEPEIDLASIGAPELATEAQAEQGA